MLWFIRKMFAFSLFFYSVLAIPPMCPINEDIVYSANVQLGPRPFYLVNDMKPSPLKDTLAECARTRTTYQPSEQSIGHRGSCLFFPEHSRQSYEGAANLGAGVVECDVTFTKDKELVCRHSQCDLHSSTDILLREDLAPLCSQPFVPATFGFTGHRLTSASAKCCTSDITLKQFKTLRAKMDGVNDAATNVTQYVWGGIPTWRTDLFESNGTVMSHLDSIHLLKQLGVKMIPELKKPLVPMPFDGFTLEHFAQKIIDEYVMNEVTADMVYPQSLLPDVIYYWLENAPDFGRNALYLWDPVDKKDFRNSALWPDFAEIKSKGVTTFSPPMYTLIDLDNNSQLIISDLALRVKDAGLMIKTWTLERSGSLYNGGGMYYQSVNGQVPAKGERVHGIISRDGDVFTILHFLFQYVGIAAMFSDWPSTVTFYTNCMAQETHNYANRIFYRFSSVGS